MPRPCLPCGRAAEAVPKINRTKIAIEIAGLLKSDNFHKISCTRAETVYNIK